MKLSGWRVWLVWLALVLACAVQINRSHVVTDVSSFLPGPATTAQRLLVDQLRDGLSTRSLLLGLRLPQVPADSKPTAAQTAALVEASHALRSRLLASGQFRWVSNGDLQAHTTERDLLFSARYLLSPGGNAQQFSEVGLKQALSRLEGELLSSRASAIREIATADPTLVSLALLEQASGRLAAPAQSGVWLGSDGTVALLLMETRARGSDINGLRQAIAAAQSTATEVLRAWPQGQAVPVTEFAGASYFNVQAHDAIGQDAHRLALLALVLVAVLLWWTLRSPRFMALALIPVATGTLAGFATVAWANNGSIHGITLAFGVTLIGEAVDYAIYAFVQADNRGDHGRGFWRKVTLAALTSLIGFAAMYFSGFAGLQQLGLFSIAGLVVAVLVTRCLLPGLFPPKPATTQADRFAWLPGLCRRMRRWRWPLLALTLGCCALLAQRHDALWQDSLDALSTSSPEATARDLRFRTDTGVPDLRSMVAVNGSSLQQALQRAEALTALLDQLVTNKTLAGYSSPTALVPSDRVQEQRRATLPPPDVLRTVLMQAAQTGNLKAQAFEPFLADVEASRQMPRLSQAYYGGTILGAWLEGQIVATQEGVAVLVLLQGAPASASLRGMLERSGLPGVTLIDLKGDVEDLVAEYRQRAMLAALAGAALISAVLAVQLRNRRAVSAMLATIVSTVLITSGVLVLAYGQLSIFNLVSLLLVVGVSSNYALFFATLSANAQERHRASVSVVLAAGSTFIGFSTLAFSATPVLASIGITVSIGALVGLLGSMAFSPDTETGPAASPAGA